MVIHKSSCFELPVSMVNFSISGFGLRERVAGAFYEPFYHNQNTIATGVFTVQVPCNVLLSFSQIPAGLDSIQLRKKKHKHLLSITPQWHRQAQLSDCSAVTAVGCIDRPQWLTCRMDPLVPGLSRLEPDLRHFYAAADSDEEHYMTGPQYVSGAIVYPGVLANADDYQWNKTCLQKLRGSTTLKTAVCLATSESTVQFGVLTCLDDWMAARNCLVFERYGVPRDVRKLPGKLQYEQLTGKLDLVFTWGGRASRNRQANMQQMSIWLLCHRH